MRTEHLAGTCRVYHDGDTLGKAVYEIELLREIDGVQKNPTGSRVDGYERYAVSLTSHQLDLDALTGKTITLHLQDGRQLKVIVTRSGLVAIGRLN
jgi:hypothetical protein